jgi:hypothetical protein
MAECATCGRFIQTAAAREVTEGEIAVIEDHMRTEHLEDMWAHIGALTVAKVEEYLEGEGQ